MAIEQNRTVDRVKLPETPDEKLASMITYLRALRDKFFPCGDNLSNTCFDQIHTDGYGLDVYAARG